MVSDLYNFYPQKTANFHSVTGLRVVGKGSWKARLVGQGSWKDRLVGKFYVGKKFPTKRSSMYKQELGKNFPI